MLLYTDKDPFAIWMPSSLSGSVLCMLCMCASTDQVLKAQQLQLEEEEDQRHFFPSPIELFWEKVSPNREQKIERTEQKKKKLEDGGGDC